MSLSPQSYDLICALIANPTAVLLRRIYADHLEENGFSDGADFIRGQCDGHIAVHFTVNSNGLGVLWKNGFIERIYGSLDDILKYGPFITHQHPVRRVRVTDKWPYLDEDDCFYWISEDELFQERLIEPSPILPRSICDALLSCCKYAPHVGSYPCKYHDFVSAMGSLNHIVLADIQKRSAMTRWKARLSFESDEPSLDMLKPPLRSFLPR